MNTTVVINRIIVTVVMAGFVLPVMPVSAGTSTDVIGSFKIAADLSRRSSQELAVKQAANIITVVSATLDPDGDGFPEAPVFITGAGPAGGGLVPTDIGAPVSDGYGGLLGYCVWDNGSVVTTGVNRLAGSTTNLAAPSFAVVSAGLDGVFNRTCAQIAANTVTSDDDFVMQVSTNQIKQGVGGTVYFGDPVDTKAALLLLNIATTKDGELRLVKADNTLWRWSSSSTPPAWTAAATTAVLSSLTAATTANLIDNAANAQRWNWQLSSTGTGFAIGETAASTGGSVGQYLTTIGTLAGSTAIPLSVTVRGAEAFRVDSLNPQIVANIGSATAPSYAFNGAQGTGMYLPVANTIGFATNSVARLTIDPTGNVGIGTTTPGVALDVAGTIRSATTAYPNFQYNTANRITFGENFPPPNEAGSIASFGSGSGSRSMLLMIGKSGFNSSTLGNDGVQTMLGSEGYTPITFRTGLYYSASNIMGSGIEVMRLAPNGNVLIGSATDSGSGSKLQVTGNADVSGRVNSSNLLANGYSSIDRQGAFLQWNRDNSSGQTYLINQKGSGTNSGISFGEATTTNVYQQNMFLDATGNLSTRGGLATGGDIIPGGKIVVQNGQDGGTGRGIFLYSSVNTDWGIYMGTSGASKSLSGGTATPSLDGRTGFAARSRIFNAATTSFVWENSSEQALMSLTGDTGNLNTKGNIVAGGTVTATSFSGNGAGLTNLVNSFNTRTGAVTLTLNDVNGVTSFGTGNTTLGTSSLSTTSTGTGLTAFGNFSLNANTSGNYSTAIGMLALQNNTTGVGNSALGSGTLRANGTGSSNVAIGRDAGNQTSAGVATNANLSGSNNTFLGAFALPGTATQLNYASVIGSDAIVTTSNTVVLGRATDNTVIGATGDDGSGSKLQVTGGIKAFNSGNSVALSLINFGGGGGSYLDLTASTYGTGYTNSAPATIRFVDDNAYSNSITFRTKTTGASANADVERMRITAGGNLLIGSATDDGSGNVLQVTGGIKSTGNLTTGGDIVAGGNLGLANGKGIFFNTIADKNWGIYRAQAGATNSLSGQTATASVDGRAGPQLRFRAASSVDQGFIWENHNEQALMSLTSDTGNLFVKGSMSAASYITTSDRRLKENIVAVDRLDTLERLKKLNGYQYNLINDSNKAATYGVLAQEILTLFPNTVRTGSNGFYAVDYGALSALTATAVGQLAINMEKYGLVANAGNAANAANGALMIGNGKGFTLGTLTADTGISITNAAGQITIKNTGVTGFNGRTGNVTLGLADVNAATGFGNGNYTAGTGALAMTSSGAFNTAVGQGALASTGDGSGNSAQGYQALLGNVGGSNNVAIGRQAGYASRSGMTANANLTGSNNTFVGAYALPGTVQQLSYATAIGSDAIVTTSGTIVLGRSDDVTVLGAAGDDHSGNRLQVTGSIKATGRMTANSLQLTTANRAGIWIDNGAPTGSGNGLVQAGDSTLLFSKGTIDGPAGLVIGPWASASNGLRISNSGVTVGGGLTVNGGITGSAGYAMVSDARFKKNIDPIKDAIALISKLEGVRYEFDRGRFPERNFEGGRQLGLIAQQVEPILPELVRTDADGYKSLQYSQLAPLLIEGIKAQQAILKHLVKKDPTTLTVDIKTFQGNDAVFENIKSTNIKTANLEVETARIKKLEADRIDAKVVRSDVVKTGEAEVFVSAGTFQPIFAPQADSQYIVNVTAEDGSSAFASVAFMGGKISVTPISGKGVDVTSIGAQVGLVAASKKVKATWIRMS